MNKLKDSNGYYRAASQLNAMIENEAQRLPSQSNLDFANQTGLEKGSQAARDVFFTTSVLGMTSISHVIEDQALAMGSSIRFYSSFQKFSRVRPQEERYRQLLAAQIPVYLFGMKDDPLWVDPNLHLIALPGLDDALTPSLTNNWFVVLDNPNFVSMALVSHELPRVERPAMSPDKLVYRSFEGFWTYNKEVISHVVSILDEFIKGYTSINA